MSKKIKFFPNTYFFKYHSSDINSHFSRVQYQPSPPVLLLIYIHGVFHPNLRLIFRPASLRPSVQSFIQTYNSDIIAFKRKSISSWLFISILKVGTFELVSKCFFPINALFELWPNILNYEFMLKKNGNIQGIFTEFKIWKDKNNISKYEKLKTISQMFSCLKKKVNYTFLLFTTKPKHIAMVSRLRFLPLKVITCLGLCPKGSTFKSNVRRNDHHICFNVLVHRKHSCWGIVLCFVFFWFAMQMHNNTYLIAVSAYSDSLPTTVRLLTRKKHFWRPQT